MAIEILFAIAIGLLFYIAASLSQLVTSMRSGRSESEASPRAIQVVVAGHDDVVIFRVENILKAEQREELRAHLVGGLGGGRKCFVLENGIHLDAVIQVSPQTARVSG